MKRRHVKNYLLRLGAIQFLGDMSRQCRNMNGENSTAYKLFEALADSLNGNKRCEFESEKAPFILDDFINRIKRNKEMADRIKDDLDVLQYIADNWEKMKGEYLWS